MKRENGEKNDLERKKSKRTDKKGNQKDKWTDRERGMETNLK